MKAIQSLFNLIGGHILPEEDDGPATRVRLILLAGLATTVFAAIYGIAAGSTDLTLAFSNIYKLPMVILLSSLCAVPAGLLTWKLLGAKQRATDILMGQAAGNFTGTLVMAALSPIVALYYHTSGYLGGTLALGTCYLGLGVGLLILVRAVLRRAPEGLSRYEIGLPTAVLIAVQLAAMVQFIYIASPILPELTVFDGGMDAIVAQ
ncbi:MAG: hypothetical protein H6739_22070 [Alphaproteobacteria bacterium]|nr:hypothetical protein [Alphaproteobacteria bacterium]